MATKTDGLISIKLPPGIGDKLEDLIAGNADAIEGMTDKIKGMFRS